MARDVDTLYAVVPTEWTERGMETVRSINVHVSCANGSYTYQDLKKDQWGWVGPTVTSKIEKMRAGEKKDRGKLRLVSPDAADLQQLGTLPDLQIAYGDMVAVVRSSGEILTGRIESNGSGRALRDWTFEDASKWLKIKRLDRIDVARTIVRVRQLLSRGVGHTPTAQATV